MGHIAHLNLRDELREFRHRHRRVLLDKNPRLRTVVNKIGTIESEFRVPTWELLAGDTSLETEVRQHGVTFKVDFGEVYWNSRLEAEHKRVIDSIKPGEILCDVMAGIGPFAVSAAKAGRRVYASDLNPQCTRYLRLNARANKVKNLVKCYNLDARAFIRAAASRSGAEGRGRRAFEAFPRSRRSWTIRVSPCRDLRCGGRPRARMRTTASPPRARRSTT